MTSLTTLPKRWILIRGLTRSHFHWFNFKAEFQSQMNPETLDFPELPGNGYLSQLNSPKDLSSCVAELKKQIQPIHEPVGLIGISMGGMIATQWALEFPQEIKHLVLINSSFSLSPFYQRLMPRNYWSILKCLIHLNNQKIEEFILSTTCNTSLWKKVLKDCADFQAAHPIQLKNFIQQLRMTKHSQFTQKPNCKVQVLTSKYDRLVSFKCSEKIAAQWQVPLNTHPTAGHDLPMDDCSWIIDTIKKG